MQQANAGSQTPPSSGEPAAATPQVAAPAIDEAKIKTFVQGWVDAQNKGDFDAYSASYAQRLTGIKRVGTKTKTFAREGWLVDRKRMFKKPMVVKADSLSIRSGARSAVVQFEQSWSSGRFADKGPKQLLLVLKGDKLGIAREEMLSSTIVGASGDTKLNSGLLFKAPIRGGFILSEAQHDWSKGKGRLVGKSPYIIARKVSDQLPEEYRLKGKPIYVYGEKGACVDTIKDLHIVVGLTPHFGYYQDEDDQPEKKPQSVIASEIFAMGIPYLIADLEGKCNGDIAEIAPQIQELSALLPTNKDAYAASLQKAWDSLDAVTAMQTEADSLKEEEESEPPKPWAERTELKVFSNAESSQTIAVMAGLGGYGCGNFYGALTAFFSIDAKGKIKLLGTLDEFFVPSQILDLKKDGRLEFVGSLFDDVSEHSTLIRKTPKGFEVQHRFSWEYQDCPC